MHFLDSNLLVYLLEEDVEKAEIVSALIIHDACISTQVINETIHTLLRKKHMPFDSIQAAMHNLLQEVKVQPVDITVVRRGWRMKERYEYSYYDSLILAAALEVGCTILYSEDLQHGHTLYEGLKIQNPFRKV